MTFDGSLVILLSKVTNFALEPVGLTLKKLEAGLLGAGKVEIKLGLLVFAALELSLN